MGLLDYVRSLARGWVVLVIGALLGTALASAYVFTTTPVYTTDTQLFVSGKADADVSQLLSTVQFTQDRTASYAALLTGRELAGTVIDDLGLDMTTDQLMSEITAQVLPETVILEVTVTDTSPSRAVAIADALNSAFQAKVQQLETSPGDSSSPVTVDVVAQPELPTAPSSPAVVPLLAAGFLVGLALGGAVAVVRDRLDDSVRSEDDATDALGSPVLGLVPDVEVPLDVEGPEQGSPLAEAFRVVRSNLQFVTVDHKARIVMVTSPAPAEGKTTTSVRLAQVLAAAGRSVLLVEADLRRPRITRYLGLISGAGLTSVLSGAADLDDVLQPVGSGGLTVLGAGPTPPNPSELLGGEAMGALLLEAASRFDVVLLDAPPLLPVADAGGLAALCDGVVVCARFGVSRAGELERSRALLDRAGARILGVVLTFVPKRATGRYDYSYSDDASEPKPSRKARKAAKKAAQAEQAPKAAPPARPAQAPEPRLIAPVGWPRRERTAAPGSAAAAPTSTSNTTLTPTTTPTDDALADDSSWRRAVPAEPSAVPEPPPRRLEATDRVPPAPPSTSRGVGAGRRFGPFSGTP